MMKSNYKNTQNKLQEDCANWFIELIKKGYLKKITFSKNFKGFYKNDFEVMIPIYLSTKKESTYFLNFKKKLFTFIVSKEFITKFQFDNKIYFTYFYKKWMNFYNFFQKSISICFHLRKVIYTNY